MTRWGIERHVCRRKRVHLHLRQSKQRRRALHSCGHRRFLHRPGPPRRQGEEAATREAVRTRKTRKGKHSRDCLKRKCPGWDSNPHCTDFEAVSSTDWDTGASPEARSRNHDKEPAYTATPTFFNSCEGGTRLQHSRPIITDPPARRGTTLPDMQRRGNS